VPVDGGSMPSKLAAGHSRILISPPLVGEGRTSAIRKC
jgi:hypothetical protein